MELNQSPYERTYISVDIGCVQPGSHYIVGQHMGSIAVSGFQLDRTDGFGTRGAAPVSSHTHRTTEVGSVKGWHPDICFSVIILCYIIINPPRKKNRTYIKQIFWESISYFIHVK